MRIFARRAFWFQFLSSLHVESFGTPGAETAYELQLRHLLHESGAGLRGADRDQRFRLSPVRRIGDDRKTLGQFALEGLAKRKGDEDGGFHEGTLAFGTGEEGAGLFQMGDIEHDAVERDDTDIAGLFERLHYRARMGEI